MIRRLLVVAAAVTGLALGGVATQSAADTGTDSALSCLGGFGGLAPVWCL